MKKEKSRVINYARNMICSSLSQIIIIVLGIVSRRVFVDTLAATYLGINGLFSNILTLLSLAELGVGSAITYSLYKPIKEDDIESIKSLMQLYKMVYCIIGVFIMIAGVALTPFLHIFVAELPEIENIRLIFLLFVVQTSSSYFFSYKLSYLTATQNDYLLQIINILSNIITSIAQILILIFLKDFILYLVISIVIGVAKNVFASIYVGYHFPYLKEKDCRPIPSDEKKKIKKNIIALSIYKVSSTLSVTIDTLLISKLMGILEVAIYSNYHLIITYSDKLFTTVLGTITPSLGNFLTNSDKKKKILMINTLQLIYSWMGTYFAVGMIVLFNPLIEIWLGTRFLFPQSIVVALVVSATLTNFQRPCALVRDADGLFWHGKLRPLAMTIINIISSIVFVKLFGTIGVVLGTILAKISTYVWYDPFIVFKYSIKSGLKQYAIRYILEWCFLLLLSVVCKGIYSICSFEGFFALIFGFIEITMIVNIFLFIVYRKTREFDYLKNSVSILVNSRKRKEKKSRYEQ